LVRRRGVNIAREFRAAFHALERREKYRQPEDARRLGRFYGAKSRSKLKTPPVPVP
jgi:hypothetical protein